MSENPTMVRLWFMDWHGRVLSHDPIKDYFSPAPFQPGIYPGLSALVPSPLKLPCDVTLEKRVSMPRLLPELEMRETPQGFVCLVNKKHNTYLISAPVPAQGSVLTNSTNLGEWEQLLIIQEDFMRGLSTLMVPNAATLIDTQNDQALSPLQLRPGFVGESNGKRLPLKKNTPAIEELGRLPAGHKAEITFHEDGKEQPLIIRVQRPG
ncbi:hypothetical protein BAR24_03810 [Gluconobacter oxydans]|jgi:hypothetical protein|uniref:Uncharacterized protein n=1 Tax=Gluconobacter thailandicus TaxID=257438 RepID=A0AAP9JHX3_GLUTH|nr:hypothetical protein [Gluconobacter thailandicus]AFW00631.1 hypothetical protein B932_1044 [Gluconobacter oxydans H24]ANQ40670.1 hypothetical protein BAR24_03810 [Gluconobacter oxydans]QEH95854.1 hypothetical protein FXF46_05845 [Gluconobacter thailandicus]